MLKPEIINDGWPGKKPVNPYPLHTKIEILQDEEEPSGCQGISMEEMFAAPGGLSGQSGQLHDTHVKSTIAVIKTRKTVRRFFDVMNFLLCIFILFLLIGVSWDEPPCTERGSQEGTGAWKNSCRRSWRRPGAGASPSLHQWPGTGEENRISWPG